MSKTTKIILDNNKITNPEATIEFNPLYLTTKVVKPSAKNIKLEEKRVKGIYLKKRFNFAKK